VDENLKRKMGVVRIIWSGHIGEAIRQRIELEKRREAAERLLEGLRAGKPVAPQGFINETIRKMREAR